MQPSNRLVFLGTGTLLFLAIIVILNVLSLRGWIRQQEWDFTEEQKFTLSQGTKNILSGLEDDVHLTWYLSKNLPSRLQNIKRETVDKLEQMIQFSGRHFKFDIIDPSKDEVLKTELEKENIGQVQEMENEFDQARVIKYFSAMKITYLSKKPEIVNFYNNTQQLEYNLMSRILRMKQDRPKVGLLKPKVQAPRMQMPMMPPQQPKDNYGPVFNQVISKDFEVIDIDLDAKEGIPEDLKALVIIKPGKLSDRWHYEIEKFLCSGGNILLLASGIDSIPKNQFLRDMSKSEEKMEKLLVPLGLQLGEDFLAENQNFGAIQVPMNVEGLNIRMMQMVQIPLIPIIVPGGMNQDTDKPYTRRLQSLALPFATEILADKYKIGKLGLEFTVLAKTSPQSCSRKFKPDFYTNREVQRVYRTPPTQNEYIGNHQVCVLLEGKFPFQYEGKPIPAWKNDKDKNKDNGDEKDKKKDDKAGQTAKLENPNSSRLIVLSCPEAFSIEYLQMQMYNPNILFLLNTVEAFTFGPDLISIRVKQNPKRPLKRLENVTFTDFQTGAINPQGEGRIVHTGKLREDGKNLLMIFGQPPIEDIKKIQDALQSQVSILHLLPKDLTQKQLKEYGEKKPQWFWTKDNYNVANFLKVDKKLPAVVVVDVAKKVWLEQKFTNPEDLIKKIREHEPEDVHAVLGPTGWVKLGMIASTPILILLFGLGNFIYRTSARRRYEAKFKL